MDYQLLVRLHQLHVDWLTAAYNDALRATEFDVVVVHSGSPKKRSEFDDQYWPLRATPHFQHWVPVADPDSYLVFEAGKRPVLVWPECASFWERPAPPESMHFLETLDVQRTAAPEIPTGKRVAWIGEDAARAAGLRVRDVNPPDLVAALDRLRTLKSPYEIACLAEANRRAALGHEAVRNAFCDGELSELELHLRYLAATRQDDPETPYKNIVALGASGAVLHHVSYGRNASRAESLLLDAGATYLGYASDVTRTWVKARGEAAKTFAALVAAMESMQQRLVDAILRGKAYEELHDESHRGVSEILKEAGLARGSVEEIDAKGVSRAFYPHGLGHSLGLQTHDVGCAVVKPRKENPFLRNTSVIREGQVFTIEPGLYFIDGLLAELRSKPEGQLVDWNAVDALAPFGGIRIEDDVFVLPNGVRNLTREVLPLGGGTV